MHHPDPLYSIDMRWATISGIISISSWEDVPGQLEKIESWP